jgi:hypothetical protein
MLIAAPLKLSPENLIWEHEVCVAGCDCACHKGQAPEGAPSDCKRWPCVNCRVPRYVPIDEDGNVRGNGWPAFWGPNWQDSLAPGPHGLIIDEVLPDAP